MENKKSPFDFKAFEEEAIKSIREGKPLEGKDGVLTPLIKRWLEAGLNGEAQGHVIETKPAGNRPKTTDLGLHRATKHSKAVE